MLSVCIIDGIGFSCVTFALNTVTGIMHVGDPTIESSVPDLPVCFHVWIHLAVTQICFPQSNFFGHLIGMRSSITNHNVMSIKGISTGLIRAFCPRPFLWIRKKVTGFVRFVTQQPLCNRYKSILIFQVDKVCRIGLTMNVL